MLEAIEDSDFGFWKKKKTRKIHHNNIKTTTLGQFSCLSNQDPNFNRAPKRQFVGRYRCALNISQRS